MDRPDGRPAREVPMAPLRYLESPEPELNEPILIGAFAGWSDAGGGYLPDRDEYRAPDGADDSPGISQEDEDVCRAVLCRCAAAR